MIDKEQQAKHWKNKSLEIIDSYFVSPPATKRSLWLCEQLKAFNFSSILEVGSFAGRNLFYIENEFKNVSLYGIEINPVAVCYSREKVPKAIFTEMDLHNLDDLTCTFDLVFTSGVLIHIPPEDLKSVIEKIIRRSDKYMVHLEELGQSELIACPHPELNPKKKVSDQWQWNADLITIYKNLGFNPIVIDLPSDMQTNGAKQMIVVGKYAP